MSIRTKDTLLNPSSPLTPIENYVYTCQSYSISFPQKSPGQSMTCPPPNPFTSLTPEVAVNAFQRLSPVLGSRVLMNDIQADVTSRVYH
jgi:hypothetical protein